MPETQKHTMATQLVITALLIGLSAGVLSGLVGVGGGIIMVPALVFFMHYTQHQAQGTSLAVIGGRPAIAYQNNTNSNIRYVRANDADGTSWPNAGFTIGTSGATDVHLDLEEVGGLPAVAYHRSQTYDLYYERVATWIGTVAPPLK